MTIVVPRSDDPRVSIIIPSSIRTDLLYACLESLVRSGPGQISYETIVVLNETGAAAAAALQQAVRGVEFVRSPVNLGVAAPRTWDARWRRVNSWCCCMTTPKCCPAGWKR